MEIIAIGDELLNGSVVDSNSAWLGRETQRLGIIPRYRQVVADTIDDISNALKLASGRSDVVVCCGGLGPTVDDLTANAAAHFLGTTAELNAEALAQIEQWRERAGGMLKSMDEQQARLPLGATVHRNPVGTAPAFSIKTPESKMFFFAGVPREWKELCKLYLLPLLEKQVDKKPADRTWKFFGYTESQLATHIDAINTSDIALHYRAHFPEIHVRAVTDSMERIKQFEDELHASVGHRSFGGEADTIEGTVHRLLLARKWSLACAESCTGGRVSQMLTSIPGSSDTFKLGAVTYSNESKCQVLGVPADLIAEHGAVSQPVVEAMANSGRELAGSTLCVAISGIAGPGGGTADKPVGTVHFALATPEGVTHKVRHLPWDRQRNQIVAAYVALDMIRKACLIKSGDWRGTLATEINKET